MTTRLLRAAVQAGARGIVLSGTGIGNAPPGVARAVADIVDRGVVVALSTRVAAGPVLRRLRRRWWQRPGGGRRRAGRGCPRRRPASRWRCCLSSGRSPRDVSAALGSYACNPPSIERNQ